MTTPRTNRQVATALLAIVLCACAPVDSGPSPTEPEPTATVKNTVRLVFDKPLYGKEALRAIIDSRREEIHDLENDPDLRDRTHNPDSVIAFLRTEIGTLEDQLAIPEMTPSRADSLRALFRSKANELASSGRSAMKINGHWTTIHQLKMADSILGQQLTLCDGKGGRLATYRSVVDARGRRIETTQRTADLFSISGVPVPFPARQRVLVDVYVDGDFGARRMGDTRCSPELRMTRQINVIKVQPVLACHPAINLNVAWDATHELWKNGGWVSYLSGSSRTVTIPENRRGCSCNGGGEEGGPPTASCGGSDPGVPPNDCSWVTVELWIDGLLARSWRIWACG